MAATRASFGASTSLHQSAHHKEKEEEEDKAVLRPPPPLSSTSSTSLLSLRLPPPPVSSAPARLQLSIARRGWFKPPQSVLGRGEAHMPGLICARLVEDFLEQHPCCYD